MFNEYFEYHVDPSTIYLFDIELSMSAVKCRLSYDKIMFVLTNSENIQSSELTAAIINWAEP